MFTVAAFGLCAWVCGALLFPLLVRSPADRWVLAAGAGTAAAAVAALWGNSWAGTEKPREAGGEELHGGADVNASGHGVAIRGDNHGIISTGRNAKNAKVR
jgi:hypothetical protein